MKYIMLIILKSDIVQGMEDSFSNTQLKQIKDVFREVLNEKMNWNIKGKLSNIENNLEEYLKTSIASLKSMRDFNAKYASLKK